MARDARYAALAGRLAPGEALLTAHHRDDQLETLLLQPRAATPTVRVAVVKERVRAVTVKAVL